MYYKVVEEICKNGTKSRYSKNQIIDDIELNNLMNDFKENRYEIKDELQKKYYNFFNYNWCGEKIELYFLDLNKIK